jgi:hypothetical protein
MREWTATLLFATVTMGTRVPGTGLPRVMVVLALGALVQLPYWLLLRRHFARGDLV